MRLCKTCDHEKKLHKFVKSKTDIEGFGKICKKCHSKRQKTYRKASPEKAKNARLKNRYGITLEDYNRMKEEQNHSCKICKKEDTKLYVDHCHDKTHVRSLLCPQCNYGLGNFKDSEEYLLSAIKYLLEHGK